MRRRDLLVAFPAVAAASPVGAQRNLPVIALLSFGKAMVAGFAKVRVGLEALGLFEGRDFAVVVRDAAGDPARLPGLAADLLASRPAVVLLGGHVTAKAIRDLSRTTPIVVNGMNDPVAAGLVTSLFRPGGNITGVTNMTEEAQATLVEILREMLPAARRIAVVLNPQNDSLQPMVDSFRRRAAGFGMAAEPVVISHPNDLDAALGSAPGRVRPDALLVMQDAALQFLAADIAVRALARRVPCFGTQLLGFVEAGALFTYAKDADEAARSVAFLLAKILRGAPAGDLSVEQPTRFHLRINLGTARALGIAVPSSVLARAAEVVE
jgi:putative ABC transport system substrate-binding protein